MKLTKRNPVAKHMNQVTRPAVHDGGVKEAKMCRTCYGDGDILVFYDRTGDLDNEYMQCPTCKGSGHQ